MLANDAKIGVYICHCGGNISDTVDVERVRQEISKLRGVVVAKTYEYVCSDPGQEMIVKGIQENGLNRIVVASCSPRMHLDTFRRTLQSAGLNPYFLEMANIREQCSWVHSDKEAATLKAVDLIRGAVERVRHHKPLETRRIAINRNVLVIGGGIAGIITSIELADKGYQVYLVEKSPSIGGHMAQLSKTFPTLDCSSCILTPKMVYASQHPRIKIFSLADVAAIEGSPGNYRVLVTEHPRYVEDNCLACGECTKYCPVKVPCEFEAGLSHRKAIYSPFKQAVPRTYVIDKDHCLYFTKGVCRVCERFCKAKAINFNQKDEVIELEVGAIVVCTGFDQTDPHKFEEYSYGLHPNIITNLQFERVMLGGFGKPSDGKPPKKAAFVLCVGSRTLDESKGVKHCCKIGCMAAIKQAVLLQKAVPDADPWIFYTDIRADGKGYEEFYMTAQEHNVHFVRGRVAEITPINKDEILVRAEDTFFGKIVEGVFDLVVLSMGIIPSHDTWGLAKKLGIQVGGDGFILERHYKLRPVDSQREGVFAAGCAMSPKDVRETTLEAMATASRVATFLGQGEISVSPEVAYVSAEKCDNCGICIDICPVKAFESSSEKVSVNPLSCVGCGICVPKCPKQAIDLNHCTEEQLLAQIHGVCEGGIHPKIIAFVEKNTAYASADLAGQSRASYPPNVEMIMVPTTGRIGLKHVLYALAAGADGVIFIEDHGGIFTEDALREHVDEMKKELRKYGIEPLRLLSISTTIPQYDKILNVSTTLTERLRKLGTLSEDARAKLKAEICSSEASQK